MPHVPRILTEIWPFSPKSKKMKVSSKAVFWNKYCYNVAIEKSLMLTVSVDLTRVSSL